MTDDLRFAPAWKLADRIREGDLAATTLVEASLEGIAGDDCNAFVTVDREGARARAREADRAIEAGESVGPLHGLPVALKDLAGYAGMTQTFGCRLFADNVATRTAEIARRLEAAGAVVVGKTNTPEFGHRPVTDNALQGPTSTPFDLERNSGGSSGGSAAAVADGLVAIGQGGDAAGSVRIPAAFCGVYGLKPSFGRIPKPARPNPFQYHTPFVDKGLLTRTVRDAAVGLDAVSGPHPRDPLSLPEPDGDYREACEEPIDDWSIAYSPDLGTFPVSAAVADTVADALGAFEREGATVDPVEIDLGGSLEELARETRYGLMEVFSATIADGLESGFGVDFLGADAGDVPAAFRDRVEAGRAHTPVDVARMNRVRARIFDGIQDAFESYDLLVTPTVSVVPIRNDSLEDVRVDGEAVDPAADWLLTWPINMTGHPAASIPAGFVDGLPVGLQIVGPRFGDDRVLAASAAFERRAPWQETAAALLRD